MVVDSSERAVMGWGRSRACLELLAGAAIDAPLTVDRT
jgi:hypothetical protein